MHRLEGREPMEVPDSMIGAKLTVEELVGRNFYHFTDGVRDTPQPLRLTLPDLALNACDDEYDDAADDDEGDAEEDWGFSDEGAFGDEEEADDGLLSDKLPGSCWVKRFAMPDELGPDIYLMYALQLDDSMAVVKEFALLDKPASRAFFVSFAPAAAREYSHMYLDFAPVEDLLKGERKALLAHRYLMDGFSFVGRRLPQSILDEGGDGGEDTEYSLAIQSAHRLAYTQVSIAAAAGGLAESFSYSSYLSSGDGYGDMFSRPQLLEDRHEEVVDMLLYVLDQYTEEECAQALAHPNRRGKHAGPADA